MSIQDEITRIKGAKVDIKDAIEDKGITVGDGTIDTYAEKIENIVTPSGSVEITENGQGVDIAQYATANVNVSGGGGIPDIDIPFGELTPSSQSYVSTQTIDLTGKNPTDLRIGIYDNTTDWRTYPNSASTNRSNVANLVGEDGLFHNVVTINNEDFDFKTYHSPNNPTSIYTTSSLIEIKPQSPIFPTKLDFDRAVEYYTDGHNVAIRDQSASRAIWSGKMYFVPLQFCNDTLADKYYQKMMDYSTTTISGYGNVDTGFSVSVGGMYSYSIYDRASTTSSTPASGEIVIASNNVNITAVTNSKYFVFRPNLDSVVGDLSSTKAAGYAMLIVKDGYTLAECKTDMENEKTLFGINPPTLYYMEDGEEKSIASTDITTPQDPSLKTKWDTIIASHPTDLTLAVKDTTGRPALQFAAKIQDTQYKKLSVLINNFTTATFNITDTSTWTTRSFKGVVLADEGVDLMGIDPLSHGGYY